MKAGFATLGEVAEFINGAAFKPLDWGDVGKKIIRIQNLTDSSKPYNKTTRSVNKKLTVNYGDILVSWSATLGVFVWTEKDEAVLNQHIFKVIHNSKIIDKNYLRHCLHQALDAMTKHLHGATMKHVNRGEFLATEIPLPPLAEQQRIAEVLDTADRILKLRESAIAKLDQLAQSVFSQIFLDAKHSIAIKKLGEICDVRDGTHDSPKYVNEGIPLITSKNLSRGFIDFSDVNLISNNDFFEINKRSKVDCGDILMPMIGTIGNPVIVKDQNPNFAIKNVALIKQIPNSPNSIYLKAVLEGASFKSYVEKISRGGTQKFLGLGDIRKFEISIVNKNIEEEFVNFIKKLNNMRDLYVINALKQKEMLASLQHQSFAVS